MPREGLLKVAGICLVLLGICAAPASASFPGVNGLIAYSGGYASNLYTVAPSGTDARKLTSFSTFDSTFTADGTKIAFMGENGVPVNDPGCDPHGEGEECRGEHELFTASADGSNLTAVTDSRAFELQPAWNPAGTKLVYVDAKTDDVFVVKTSDGSTERLTNSGGYTTADWSPDGQHIAVGKVDQTDYEDIWIMDADGTQPRDLTNSVGMSEYDPSWSPDGDEIAYSRSGAGRDIYRIPADSLNGSGAALVDDGSNYGDRAPVWSPDGTKIAFVEEIDEESSALYVVPATGGVGTILPVSTAPDFVQGWLGAWQPLQALESVSDTDGTVDTGTTTDSGDPLNLALAAPSGDVAIQMIDPMTPPPSGFGLLGYEFQVTAPDASIDNPLVLTFTVDASLIPPGVTEGDVEIMRDGAAMGDCTDVDDAIPDPCVADRDTLGDGDVVLAVRSSHASTWNVAAPDSTPPETTITSGPSKRTKKRTVTVKFKSSEPRSTFDCKVDRKEFPDCLSPFRTKRLSYGKHTIQVTATDEAKNADPIPAKKAFKVVH